MNALPKSGKILNALWAVILLFSVISIRPAQADVNINIFYDALAPYGNWVNHRSYGRVWYPRNVPRSWRPYTEGYWAYTIEYGWLWVSDWEWGWAPFHYGRWAWDDWYGWIWIPGSIWAPAWVFWRYGGGYAAWAPMPPNYIWRPYTSYQPYYFDHNRYLNWDCWVAVQERDFPRHRKQRRLLAPQQHRDILEVTNFINNVTVINNNVVNQGLPVQQIEKVTGERIKPIVPKVLSESETDKRQPRRDLRNGASIIYRPKKIPMSMEIIRGEEKRAIQIADKVDREHDRAQSRLLHSREPGRLTAKPRFIEPDDLPNSVLKLPDTQPAQRNIPLLTAPENRIEGRKTTPNEQQRQMDRRQQLKIQQQAEQELRAQEKALQQEEKLYRQQEIRRRQQLKIQQQAEQQQRAREEPRQQRELIRQQEIRRRQQFQMQQAEQQQRVREEARQQRELIRQQEIRRRQQWQRQQQSEQIQRGREAVRPQLEIVPQRETEQVQIRKQSDSRRQSEQTNRGRDGRSNRRERTR